MNNAKDPQHRNPIKGTVNTRAGLRGRDPLQYDHPYDSMRRYAELLALRHDSPRTRQSYYRAMRLVHEHFQADPATLGEDQLRDYILHVKTCKAWKPKTIRQTMACARLFFVEMLEHSEWKVFSQVRTRDHDDLPAVLTREQVTRLLGAIRLRRYRIPLKLIYCAGLRLSECLSLTIHDIFGDEGKLLVRGGKGGRDRMVPLAPAMVEDLRRYWAHHRHPLLLFPNAGRGPYDPDKLAARMHRATGPMPVILPDFLRAHPVQDRARRRAIFGRGSRSPARAACVPLHPTRSSISTSRYAVAAASTTSIPSTSTARVTRSPPPSASPSPSCTIPNAVSGSSNIHPPAFGPLS